MASYSGEIFDADNHYYEAHDAFTRHVPKRMRSRCVEWVELEGGRQYQVIGGKIDRSGNPTFNPISKPGVLREYFGGNPRGVTSVELIRSSLEPMPLKYSRRTPGLEIGLNVGFPERSILPPTTWYLRPLSSSIHSTQRERIRFGTWRMNASCAS